MKLFSYAVSWLEAAIAWLTIDPMCPETRLHLMGMGKRYGA